MSRYRNCIDRALGSKRSLRRDISDTQFLSANEDAQDNYGIADHHQNGRSIRTNQSLVS